MNSRYDVCFSGQLQQGQELQAVRQKIQKLFNASPQTLVLTGCMALIEEFEGLRVLHRFTVELLMVYFPFSRLMHAFMFIPSRAFTGAWFGRRGVKA